MNHLLEDEDDLQGRPNHRELTLSTSAVLGIFFGLALICGLFFAFGYNMGHKSTQPALATVSDAAAAASPTANFSSFKPAAGSPVGTAPSTPIPLAVNPTSTSPSALPATPRAVPAAPMQDAEVAPVRPSAVLQPPASVALPTHPPVAAPVAEASPGNFIVQVAAVSHQEDADLLVGALKGKGYAVAARSESQDKLVHIQVGPFTNRKDAEAMRQRLLGDGYNAIVK